MIKEYKNTMKAKAWIVMLLIGMISFTGFCYTPDLIQNSEIETVTSKDVLSDSNCVNVASEMNLVKKYRVYKGQEYFVVKIFKDANCEIIVCSKLIKAPDIIGDELTVINRNLSNKTRSQHIINFNKSTDYQLDINCIEPRLNNIYRKSRDALRTESLVF